MERIKLDLVPGCVKPILHASQYDNDREWTCDILDNEVPYKFVSGDTCEIHVRKGDNCAVTASVPVTVGQSYVVVTSTEQMCAVSGDNLAELVIMNGTKKIGSCNLILSVEADPLNGSKSSASEIHDLQAQVDDCVDEALSHKGASDIAFDNTDTGLEATNVQDAIEEVNTKTDEKADADDVYDKTYMDGIFEQIDNAFTNVNNTKMDKNNPVGTGSFSFNRREGSTVGNKSVALGNYVVASGSNSFASGYGNSASGAQSTAMGNGNRASGNSAMAINTSNTASGEYSLAQGALCEAKEYASHAEGYSSKASGYVSHAEGQGTIANHISQHASGEFNIPDDSTAREYYRGNYVEIVGNGTSDNNRSNARTLDWSGNETLAGDLTYNGNKSITSEVQRLDDKIDNLPAPMIFKGTLGVGGTIQTLPAASASNEGWTYKVITDGTYDGQAAKVGDVFTSNGSAWVYIPSGDEDNDTWRAIKVNGVEMLGNGISSGSLDVVDTDNIEAEFDDNGNKLKIKTKNIYTQSEVDTLIANAVDSVLPTDSVSKSAIATFETDLAKPIELKAYIEATQASGTPTPSTPLAISGWSEVNLYQLGGNFFDKDTLSETGKLINGSGNEVSYADWCISDFIPVIEGESYYFYGITTHPNTNQDNFELFDENKSKVGFANVKTNEQPYLIPSGVKYIKCTVKNPDLNTAQFGVSQNASYVPYTPTINTVTIALGDTYYGGYVTQDKLGHRQLVVTSEYKVVDNSKIVRDSGTRYSIAKTNLGNFNANGVALMNKFRNRTAGEGYSVAGTFFLDSNNLQMNADQSYASKNDFLNAYGEITICYTLATPVVIDLPDGEPLNALIGTNNLFADSGDIECSFKCGVAMYVDNHSGGGNRSVNLAKSVEEEVKEEETKDEPITRQER